MKSLARIGAGVGIAFIGAGSAYFGGLSAFAVDASLSPQDFVLAGIPAGTTFFGMLMLQFGGQGRVAGR